MTGSSSKARVSDGNRTTETVDHPQFIAIAPLASITLIPVLQESQYPGNSIILAHLAAALGGAAIIALYRKQVGEEDRASPAI